MLVHPDLQGDDGVQRRVRDAGAGAAVDDAVRQVEQQVDDARGPAGLSQQRVVERRHLRPDAGQRGDGREERVQEGRAHGRFAAAGTRSIHAPAGAGPALGLAVFRWKRSMA